ncbi:ATP-dependent Clp protease ATP-binding subunit [Thermoclostridium caenicola]|uniref:ATP-dependent Clp protease ATP-binding subunit ClpE n=1 Tax=Thermoclostridium caenicola TaxID=659425 RepID=A0A1M6BSA8_9FIRM|nr:ATP-dependent Clp protease ATP-binding subunit [Thermoclostridium caenicola]SHI51670.1 ATP-dependent Clp protease ATP-binding subunit ClpE [Thermoclostridium caenicola]
MMKCSICKENVAVVFITRVIDGKTEPMGLCMSCAQKQGLAPLQQMMSQVGMTQEDLENLNEQMAELFGNMNIDEFIQSLPSDSEDRDSDDEGRNAMIRFMNATFPGFGPRNPKEPGPSGSKHESYSDKATRPNQQKPAKNPRKNLNAFGTNLNDKARTGGIDRVVGREKEIERLIQILNRRTKNNPVLLGEPGVGKTAIAEGLALRIVENRVPRKLANKEIYLLDLAAIVAGTQFRGQFEARMKAILDEAKAQQNVILVIDEIHNIVGAGEAEGGAMNAANILKPALARGDIQIIGATTLEDYRKYIEKDSALERRFQPVMVEEPSIEESIEILKGIRGYYEDFHQVRYSDEVIEFTVRMAARYIHDRFLPDKAIDVIDEAGSRVNLKNEGSLELDNLRAQLKAIQEKKEQAALHDDYQLAASYKVEECRITDRIRELESQIGTLDVTIDDIAQVIESWTSIPVQRITEDEAAKLLKLEERLHQRVIGQDMAVTSLARAIRRTRSDFRRKKKPASFIFVGPTGVGKTELARALANELFGSDDAMIRLDMSEYMEKHTVSKIIGAPPGYVGYDQGGQLTEKIRRKPYSVVLLDEIEKAHPDVFNILLQIMEDGRLTDSTGRTVNFENTLLIMTSNAGTNYRIGNIGFNREGYDALKDRVNQAIKEIFRPEFLNRVDEIVVFEQLTRDQLSRIADLMLKEVENDVRAKGMHITFSEEVKAFLIDKGFDPKYGARPLRKTIQRHIEDELAEMFLAGRIREGCTIETVMEDGKIAFRITHLPEKA